MLNRHHERIALDYCFLADIRHARYHLMEAIRAYPRRPVTYFYFISSLFGQYGLRLCLEMHRNLGRRLRQIKSTFRLIEEGPAVNREEE